MEEKIIIKSENTFAKKLKNTFGILLAFLVITLLVSFICGRKSEKLNNERDLLVEKIYAQYKLEGEKYESEAYQQYDGSNEEGLDIDGYEKWMASEPKPYSDEQVIALRQKSSQMRIISLISKAVAGILSIADIFLLILFLSAQKTSLTVTDKRVYGNAAFGKRVDLPLDMISAVGISLFKGIAIGTSSGKIKFAGISNRDEIHKAISGLLIDRQKEREKEIKPATNIIQKSDADELGKYKKLLDDGVITQEEFDAKKKQILGL